MKNVSSEKGGDGLVEKFFSNIYLPFFTCKVNGKLVYALLSVVIMFTLAIFMTVQGLKLTAPTKQEQW